MNRFPAMLSLFGLTLLTGGIGMFFRLVWRTTSIDNVAAADRQYVYSFYDIAGRDLVVIYFMAMVLGVAMFFAGLIILLARLRR